MLAAVLLMLKWSFGGVIREATPYILVLYTRRQNFTETKSLLSREMARTPSLNDNKLDRDEKIAEMRKSDTCFLFAGQLPRNSERIHHFRLSPALKKLRLSYEPL